MTHRVEVECSLVLAIDTDSLFAFVADPRNDPLWVHGCRAIEILTDAPIGIGTRLRETVTAAGIPLHIEWEILAREVPRRIVYTSRGRPLPMTISHGLLDVAVGTHFSHRIVAEPSALLYPLRPLLRFTFQREARLNVAGLERVIAKQGAAGWKRCR
jgi:uncharacterized protein YndB with AHSA1/START domain